MKNLPPRWFIRRNPENYLELNQLLRKVNGKTYTASGRSRYQNSDKTFTVIESDVFCYPTYNKRTYIYRWVPHSDYREITLQQLKNSFEIMEILNNLPQNWYIVITQENRNKVKEWYGNDDPAYSVGAGYGTIYFIKHSKLNPKDGTWTQITDEDFRFHVLKEYNLSDFREGRVVIERPLNTDLLLNSYVNKINPYNFNISIRNGHEGRYIYFNPGSTKWGCCGETNLPVVSDIKHLYKNEKMNSTVKTENYTGYTVKPEFEKYAIAIMQSIHGPGSILDWKTHGETRGYMFAKNSIVEDDFKTLKVLDIWFEKTSEKPITLPIIGGYAGVLDNGYLVYGCQRVHKSLFDTKLCKLDYMEVSGVGITGNLITQIRAYIAKNE